MDEAIPHIASDLRVELLITAEEAEDGGTKRLSYRRELPCERCAATGAAPGSTTRTCDRCEGTGELRRRKGMFELRTTCTECHAGTVFDQPCVGCNGRGARVRDEVIDVAVPADAPPGAVVRIVGKGSQAAADARPGDLFVELVVRDLTVPRAVATTRRDARFVVLFAVVLAVAAALSLLARG